MNLFLYYAGHSFKNQIKKLLKTWILLFILVCALMGGVIGVMISSIEKVADDHIEDAPGMEYVDENTDNENVSDDMNISDDGYLSEDGNISDDANFSDDEIIYDDFENSEEEYSLLEDLGISKFEFMELIIGGVVLLWFVFYVVNADKNGSKIFLPADVNLLFASPMKPQSVLMFRLGMQLGLMLFITLYMLFQIPNLTYNAGLTLTAALSLLVGMFFMMIFGTMFQVFIYMEAGTHEKVKKYLRPVLYAVLALILALYAISWRNSGLGYVASAVKIFNSPASRWIPIWGWIKGFCMFMAEGETIKAVICLGLLIIATVLLLKLIMTVKADFYEDAMYKSEEKAAALARAQDEKSTGLVSGVKRKKDRTDSLRRDGMKHGHGSNVFFFKAMYNRFRFAHFHFFTKTMETYIVSAVGVALFLKYAIETTSMIPMVLTIAGLCFYRAMGNPVEEDTKMDYFVTIPESAWSKLFWSLMGALANCALDIIPPLLIGTIILGGSLVSLCGWVVFILSVFFYATTVGSFINLSVPVSAGKMLKQFIQILFIYFGLLPDIGILGFGIATGHTSIAILGCALFNMILGLIFFMLSPMFIEPPAKRKKLIVTEFKGDISVAKSAFSRMGLAAFVMLGLTSVLQIGLGVLLNDLYPSWYEVSWIYWVVTFAPLYLVGVPLGLLILKSVPRKDLPKASPKKSNILPSFFICMFLLYVGNLIGIVVNAVLSMISAVPVVSPLSSYASSEDIFFKVLVIVILAPTIEEFVFRKCLIDRMHIYGEKLAVVLSALMFAIFHANFAQFFYAFFLGLVFGYVYLRTGKLRYSVALHMIINFLGSVLSVALLERVDLAAISALAPEDILSSGLPKGLGLYLGYLVFVLISVVIGLVLLIVKKRSIRYNTSESPLPNKQVFSVTCVNIGMILFLLSMLTLVVMTLAGFQF